VAAVKIFIMEIMLSVFIYVVREYIERIFITLLLALWLIGLAFVLVAFLRAKFHTITLDENTLTYNSGILSLRRIVLPFSRITEASYTQDLVQRIFGVGTLNVDTAGGSDVAIHVHDIKYKDLKMILDDINRRSGRGDGT
jgi:uncharacterized membrane protein YdbT with pleckstrin-like domain